MIAEYNADSHNVQIFFNDLINFAQDLGAEDKRAIAKNLTEEELEIFDLLTKPEIQLTKQEELKQVAKVFTENSQTREVSFGLEEETANPSIGGSGD